MKIVKIMFVAAMVLCLATAASARVEYNITGASAQFKYWSSAASSFLANLGCSNITANSNKDGFSDAGITTGDNCTNFTGSDKDIAIRYTSINSSWGVGVPCGLVEYSDGTVSQDDDQVVCSAGEIEGCTVAGDCAPASRVCVDVTVGASDVALNNFFQQTTDGQSWNTTDPSCPSPGIINPSGEFISAGCPGKFDIAEQTTIVPFAFMANNKIKKYRCDLPLYEVVLNDGTKIHKAYPAFQWECDPNKTVAGTTKNEDCVGYYKCVNQLCGGIDATTAVAQLSDVADEDDLKVQYGSLGQACTGKEPQECPDTNWDSKTDGAKYAGLETLANTSCVARPIDNLSRPMAVTIFGEQNVATLRYWSQFGPYYEVEGATAGTNDDIVRCLRCAGSGTHATLDMAVMRGDADIINASDGIRIFHHTSSSDLAECIGGYDGGVGYLDADKTIDDDVDNIHIMKYQGVEPKRWKIENCEYPFWAAQWLYGDTDGDAGLGIPAWTPDQVTLHGLLVNFARTEIDLIGFPRDEFWTVPGNLSCGKSPNERGYFTFGQGDPL